MKCFYHVDADGKCAGYWVYNSMKCRDIPMDDSDFRKINYGWDFPFHDIKENEEVYIVDFSLDPETMLKLLNITKNVIWIDHHVSAIHKYSNFPYKINGVRSTQYSGSMLTFYYMNCVTNHGVNPIMTTELNKNFIETAPKALKLIDDYDTHAPNRYTYGNESIYFHNAFDTNQNTEPYNSLLWDRLMNTTMVELFISQGKVIESYRQSIAKAYVESKAFISEFEGLNVFAMNIGYPANSSWFDSIDTSIYDAVMIFSYNGVDWSYSIYSKTVDCSVIASKYNGGGHKGAAGFHSDKLLLHKTV